MPAVRDDCPETPFENALLRAAIAHGWRVHCERAARAGDGSFATPIKGHQGYPDVTMTHETRGIVFAELKSARGDFGPGQADWIRDLTEHDFPGSPVLVEVWRPRDWPAIEQLLAEGVHAYRARWRGVQPVEGVAAGVTTPG